MAQRSDNRIPPPPSEDLNRQVLAGFVRQGRTLAAYCKDNGLSRHHAREALIGHWIGPTADRLRQRLYDAAGVDR